MWMRDGGAVPPAIIDVPTERRLRGSPEPEAVLTIVIISDEAAGRAALRQLLEEGEQSRHRLLEATTGATAVQVCEACRPDCVLLDCASGEEIARQTLAELRAHFDEPTFAVILLTGGDEERLPFQAFEWGAHECIRKSALTSQVLRRALYSARARLASSGL